MIIPVTMKDKVKYQVKLMRNYGILTREEYLIVKHYMYNTLLVDLGCSIINNKIAELPDNIKNKVKKIMIKKCDIFFISISTISCEYINRTGMRCYASFIIV